ncbi:GGDEF domain-containing protein [Streptomyces agglomeratus]|uniref:GGDEF domain-containing protein n=1 Tax=Streptomyces agglomeratus TaxID=285458 RepID=A0A1E5NZ78_9ACTN|nr:GGDEF domain-containing protein [Streptomyces agglomeratus]OEJ21481.1 GGDEF domain-containing protein [Streptomyces agglomeratus]OEJ36492.1 GGDEF domain-containing protein [Streptomyces agglomeratus]OEJ56491.1 GGDEF domain-containing protein [Streptomyces agglomeratus]
MTSPALPRKSLHITAAAVPLAGWTAHTIVLHRRLAAAQRNLLTGTLRREPFLTRAQRILERHPHDTIVILADADHFKTLNDTFGHAAGDIALAAIGARLTEWAGKRGAVGRLGGDEFAALTRVRPRHQALRLEHLAVLLAQPLSYDDEQLPLAVSAGAATQGTVGSRDLAVLMRAADAAMYEGKHQGVVVQARPHHAQARSVNGRREGRPGTHARPTSAAA